MKSESRLLHATCLLVHLYISTKNYRNMSKGIKVMECTRMCLRMDGRTDAMLIAISSQTYWWGDNNGHMGFIRINMLSPKNSYMYLPFKMTLKISKFCWLTTQHQLFSTEDKCWLAPSRLEAEDILLLFFRENKT